MAVYCDLYDVHAEFQRLPSFTESTTPKASQVEGWCEDIGADMDQHLLAAGVELPLVEENLLDVARTIALYGVGAKVLRSINMEAERADTLQRLYDARLREIGDNPALFSSSTTPQQTRPGYLVPTDPEQERKFHRESKDW
jgi:hypothetical protein